MKKFKHLEETGYSYQQHFKIALFYSYVFFKLACCCIIHALWPDFYTTTATDKIKKIYKDISKKN
tara:strand:+ start:127 stop:321 length:195 start_codon:yes stop_codon:yes gene_type:complete